MATANIINTKNLNITPNGPSDEGLWSLAWTVSLKDGTPIGKISFNGKLEVTYDIEKPYEAEAVDAFSYWALRHHEVDFVTARGDEAVLKAAHFEKKEDKFIREKLINSTLCYLEKDGRYLMLYRNKKKDDPCEGKWVGVGGKFEPGESKEDCLIREVYEETGLKLKDFVFHGIVKFVSDTWDNEDMYLFTGSSWEGEDAFASGTYDCDEGKLVWILKEKILSLNLWEGDKYFLEPMIRGERDIFMTCRYEGDRLVECIK